MRFNSSSGYMLSAFALLALVIGYVWWPLAKNYFSYVAAGGNIWERMDWLLIGIFSFISVLIMLGADLRKDAVLFLVGLAGGLVIGVLYEHSIFWVIAFAVIMQVIALPLVFFLHRSTGKRRAR